MSKQHATATNFDAYLNGVIAKIRERCPDVMVWLWLASGDNWEASIRQPKDDWGHGSGNTASEALLKAWHDAVGSEMPPF